MMMMMISHCAVEWSDAFWTAEQNTCVNVLWLAMSSRGATWIGQMHALAVKKVQISISGDYTRRFHPRDRNGFTRLEMTLDCAAPQAGLCACHNSHLMGFHFVEFASQPFVPRNMPWYANLDSTAGLSENFSQHWVSYKTKNVTRNVSCDGWR